MLNLKDRTLLKDRAFVAGDWIAAEGNRTFPVVCPADGTTVANVPDLGQPETKRAIDAAAKAFPAWKAKLPNERSAFLRKWFDLILANQEDLAQLIAAELGKPIREAQGEVLYGAGFVEWFAEEAKRVYGDMIPNTVPDRRSVVWKEPIGVAAAITPWNFPSAMVTRKVAPALAAGCTVILKPAEQTPLSALALAELAQRAGFPAGVLNVITGRPEVIGAELTSNPTVRKVTFTGSTEVGKLLMKQCAGTLKKLSLELGGNAPFIVFDDADLDAAAKGLMGSKFRNAGQTCVCANRILVQDKIYDAFVAKLKPMVEALRVGDSFDPKTQIGPLVDSAALEKMERLVADAKNSGATVVCGGKRHSLGRTYYEPTVLAGVANKMSVAREEIFGPVLALVRFKEESEAVQIANDTSYGLASYFYGRDVGRVWRVAEALEYGMVGVNVGMISAENAPFGGVKESGMGREGGRYGIDEFMEMKYVCVGGVG